MRFSSRTTVPRCKKDLFCARALLSHSPNSAAAQSKLIAFDLKRNLPRHLFVSSGAKRGLNATHTQRRRRTMGHYFEYTGYVCDSNRASSSCTQYTLTRARPAQSGSGSYLLLPSINPPALANNVYAITVLTRVTHCV